MSEVQLRDYLEARIETLDRQTRMQIDALQASVTKAEEVLNHRLEGMNEFRETLRDQAAKFVNREEVDTRLSDIIRRVAELEGYANRRTGQSNVTSGLWALAAASATAIVVAALVKLL